MGLLDDAIREHLDLKRRRGADPTEVEREEREVLGPVRRRGDPPPDDEPAFAHAPDDGLDHEPLPHAGEEWEDWEEEPAAEAEPGSRAATFDHDEIAPLRPDAEIYAETGPEPYAAPEPHAAPETYAAPEPHAAHEPHPAPHQAPEPYAAPEPHAAPEPYTEPSRYEAAERDMYAAREPAPHRAPDPEQYAAPERVPEPGPYHEETGHQPPPEEQTAEFNVQDAIEKEHPPHQAGQEEEDVLEETPEFLQDTPDHDRLWFEQRPPRDFDFDG
jgi:hypothetical protein